MVLVDHFKLFSKSLRSGIRPMIVFDDLNIDTLKSNNQTRKCLDTIQGNGSMILNRDATRATHKSKTCIDHMIERNIENYVFSATPFGSLSFVTIMPSKSVAISERVFYRK